MTTYYKMNEDFLAHYGVLGMKWGRRKQRINKSTSSLGGLIGTRYGKSSSGGTKQLSKRKQKNVIKKAEKHLNEASKSYDMASKKSYSPNAKIRDNYKNNAKKHIAKAEKITSKYKNIKLSDIDKNYNVTKGYDYWKKNGKWWR